jgi:hypothetical protein
MSESREVSFLGSKAERGLLIIADSEPWTLSADVGGDRYVASGFDLFDSLTKLRRALEADGLLICIQGARADVHPSGMSRQMGGGRRAYRHVSGRRPGVADLVDIFDAADCKEVVSVENQFLSIKRLRSDG